MLSLSGGKLKVSKTHGRPITDYDAWIEAVMNYEHILTTHLADPQLASKFAAYRRYIHSLQVKILWDKVYEYDRKFRAELAKSRSFEFQSTNIVNFTEVFDADSLKPKSTSQPQTNPAGKRCYRCDSPAHLAARCPFQASAAVAAQQANPSNEVCFKFNRGTCSYRLCKRQHVCISCRGQHPAYACTAAQQPAAAIPPAFNPGLPPPQPFSMPGYQYMAPASGATSGADRHAGRS